MKKEIVEIQETMIRHMESDIRGFEMLHTRIMLLGKQLGYDWEPGRLKEIPSRWVKKKGKK